MTAKATIDQRLTYDQAIQEAIRAALILEEKIADLPVVYSLEHARPGLAQLHARNSTREALAHLRNMLV